MRLVLNLIVFSSAVIIGISAMPPAKATTNEAQANQAFDFWIGHWQVHTPDGKLAGHNRIEREYNGFVLHEHYSTAGKYSGESLNIYDAARQVWHQTWVDSDGLLLVLEGQFKNGKMILEGKTANLTGAPTQHRITWTPNPDGSVRQCWESTNASGEWTVAFDGKYTRE